jgi:hypothetical protein
MTRIKLIAIGLDRHGEVATSISEAFTLTAPWVYHEALASAGYGLEEITQVTAVDASTGRVVGQRTIPSADEAPWALDELLMDLDSLEV